MVSILILLTNVAPPTLTIAFQFPVGSSIEVGTLKLYKLFNPLVLIVLKAITPCGFLSSNLTGCPRGNLFALSFNINDKNSVSPGLQTPLSP